MKISLAWLLDHISATHQELNVQQLVQQFNDTTAEVDDVEQVFTDLASLYAVQIDKVMKEGCYVAGPEISSSVTVPSRKDPQTDVWYLVKKEGDLYRWATLADIGSSKDGLLGALYMTSEQAAGSWRTKVEQEDTIITVDNKAITNRPDLWGHRGCAREVAAIIQKALVPEDKILAQHGIKKFDVEGTGEFTFAIASETCRRFAGLCLPHLPNQASLPWMAFRLARVDSRPIDMIVDLTNYVMCDLGQPMHAFDRASLPEKNIVARNAKKGESIKLLDGAEVQLTTDDCVITDGTKPISVAGVMGGSATAVNASTTGVVLESANFDPTAIRLTAARIKTRTESSARFEKSLDPNQNTDALLRYLKLLDEAQIPYEAEQAIISLGTPLRHKVIEVSHELIQDKIGMTVAPEQVQEILTRLGFGVVEQDGVYTVTVPTFRATKDVTIPEDLVEEVARFIGYSSIVPALPLRKMSAFDTSVIDRKRRLKHILAYGLSMHEVQTYAFYDEEILRWLSFDPGYAVRIANPLSEHWQRLITSLVPNLLACVVNNQAEQDTLRFFEINRVWFLKEQPIEELECAGIWYEHKKAIDFYEGKALLGKVLDALKISIKWVKPAKALAPWYNENQSAELWYGDRIVGRAGKASKEFLSTVLEGDAFLFELDANFLLNVRPEQPTFRALAKYPTTEQDISMLVPLSVTVAGLESVIRSADERISQVELIDHFEKDDWLDQKSLTFRYVAADPEGTLTKEDIEDIAQHVHRAVTNAGAHVR